MLRFVLGDSESIIPEEVSPCDIQVVAVLQEVKLNITLHLVYTFKKII